MTNNAIQENSRKSQTTLPMLPPVLRQTAAACPDLPGNGCSHHCGGRCGLLRPCPGSSVAGSPIYTNTIDRWDEATGENLIERIAGVSDYLVAVETYRAAVRRWARRQDHAAQPARVIEWEDQPPFASPARSHSWNCGCKRLSPHRRGSMPSCEGTWRRYLSSVR